MLERELPPAAVTVAVEKACEGGDQWRQQGRVYLDDVVVAAALLIYGFYMQNVISGANYSATLAALDRQLIVVKGFEHRMMPM